MRWNFANIAVLKDKNEAMMFSKVRSKDRIDGAVAAAIAVGRAAAYRSRHVFDEPNFDVSRFIL